jgi:hypothetical protein
MWPWSSRTYGMRSSSHLHRTPRSPRRSKPTRRPVTRRGRRSRHSRASLHQTEDRERERARPADTLPFRKSRPGGRRLRPTSRDAPAAMADEPRSSGSRSPGPSAR